jgi:mRNA interferase HigB
VRIITRRRLIEFADRHPDALASLDGWFRLVRKAQWRGFVDVRRTYSSADLVSRMVVFNVGGNKYRLIVFIDYERRKVCIKYVLTHAEYDTDAWKDDPWF